MAKYVPPARRPQLRGAPVQRVRLSDRHHPRLAQRLSRADNADRARRRFADCCVAARWACAAEPRDECARYAVQLPRRGAAQVFVQPIKRLHPHDRDNGQDEFAFLELKLDAATPGWLVACACDYVAFELLDGFLLAPWRSLCAIELDTSEAPIRSYRFPRQIHRRIYAPDVDDYPTGLMLTLVSLPHDVAPLTDSLRLRIE